MLAWRYIWPELIREAMNKKATIYATGERGVYVGRLERRFRRTSASSTLLVSLEDELEVRAPEDRARLVSRSFLIPPGSQLEFDTHGANVAVFFLDDFGADLERVQHRMHSLAHLGQQPVFHGMAGEAEVVDFANILRFQRPSLETAIQIVEEWLSHPSRSAALPDPRVVKAVELLKGNYERNVSVAWIAREVGLSAPHLTQLFKKTTGCSMRRFRLWHRIFVTAAKLTQNLPLTQAALAAGFSDYSQFSRTYRELVGASPAQARDNTELHISGYLEPVPSEGLACDFLPVMK